MRMGYQLIRDLGGVDTDSPFCLVGVSGSDSKLPKPFNPILGAKTSLIWIFGGSAETAISA